MVKSFISLHAFIGGNYIQIRGRDRRAALRNGLRTGNSPVVFGPGEYHSISIAGRNRFRRARIKRSLRRFARHNQIDCPNCLLTYLYFK